MPILSRDRKGTLNGQPVVYVSRRGGGHVPIPVDEDGHVPIDALKERHEGRPVENRMMDDSQVARVVRPAHLTPRQALGWWNRPGRSDIQGIDCPADAPITWQPKDRKGSKGRNGRYHPIDEKLAKAAANSVGVSYRAGTATAEYQAKVDSAYAKASDLKSRRNRLYWNEIDASADEYASRLAEATNRVNAELAGSIGITAAGPSGYDHRSGSDRSARVNRAFAELHACEDILAEMGRIGTGPISPSDPMAAEKLDARIAEAEEEQRIMKAINAYWRKHGSVIGCPEVPEKLQPIYDETFRSPGRESDKPYPDFELSGVRDRIKRLKANREKLLAGDGMEALRCSETTGRAGR